jgi:hypothetical protein
MATSYRLPNSSGLPKASGVAEVDSQTPEEAVRWPKSQSFPGTILHTMMCDTHKDHGRNEESDQSQSPKSPFEDNCFFYEKNRCFMVLNIYCDHYLALPLWHLPHQCLTSRQIALMKECIGIGYTKIRGRKSGSW